MTQRILIVEDEILVAMDLEDTLRDVGHDMVGIAPDTRTAMRLAEQCPDVAFVDINLRDGRTGMEIGRRLAVEFGVRVIFTSANTDLLGRGIDGTIGYLPKPYSARQVLDALEYLDARSAANDDIPPPPCLNLFHRAGPSH
ncbi:response regulator [Oceaniglobus indicus]|uniref:response regulator n=1 Tax=Oceaniglobus indicus TaxID=2047749 RepID=UPI000C18A827|nr:response regulator [Oceaniglobus indicus]